MNDGQSRLDGNAAAGLLSEVFAAELTSALGTCAGCGHTGAIGAAHVYAPGIGTVVRCPSCTAVLVCVTRVKGRLMLDATGLALLQFAEIA